MKIKFIKNRDLDLIPFDRTRVERAIEKAAISAWKIDLWFVDSIADDIIETLENIVLSCENEKILTIEEIQDIE